MPVLRHLYLTCKYSSHFIAEHSVPWYEACIYFMISAQVTAWPALKKSSFPTDQFCARFTTCCYWGVCMFAWSGSSDTQKWLIHRSYFPSGRWTFFAFGKWFPSHHNTIAPKTKMWPVGFTQQRHLQHAPCWLGMRLHSHHVPRTARVVPLQRVQAGTISPLSTAAFGTFSGPHFKNANFVSVLLPGCLLRHCSISQKLCKFEILCDWSFVYYFFTPIILVFGSVYLNTLSGVSHLWMQNSDKELTTI